MPTKYVVLAAIAFGGVFGWLAAPRGLPVAGAQQPQPNSAAVDRSVLPVLEPNIAHSKVLDARNAKPPPRFEVKAPGKAPNVLIVLIDDMGFGQASAFGGPIHMPTLDRMAKGGLKYNKFHTTALCSPTRACTADRPQSSRLQYGLDHRDGDRVPRSNRTASQCCGSAGRDVAAQRLQHRRVRQVARDGRVGGKPIRPNRSLADSLRLRPVLWLHRWRNEPMGAGHLRRYEPQSNCRTIRTTIS